MNFKKRKAFSTMNQPNQESTETLRQMLRKYWEKCYFSLLFFFSRIHFPDNPKNWLQIATKSLTAFWSRTDLNTLIQIWRSRGIPITSQKHQNHLSTNNHYRYPCLTMTEWNGWAERYWGVTSLRSPSNSYAFEKIHTTLVPITECLRKPISIRWHADRQLD